jgi:hypothetical protein
MLAELAVAGAIAVGAAYAAHRSSALGRGLVEVILLRSSADGTFDVRCSNRPRIRTQFALYR